MDFEAHRIIMDSNTKSMGEKIKPYNVSYIIYKVVQYLKIANILKYILWTLENLKN